MLDAPLRKVIDPPLAALARQAIRLGITANTVTAIGFLFGIAGAAAIAFGYLYIALALIILNRIADGLDGAIARLTHTTDLGGYLDIVGDFIFYAAVPLGFAVLDPARNAIPACFLLVSFIGTRSSFLAYAITAEKRKISTDIRGKKSFYYLGGLTEGTETIAFFLACCLFPSQFPILAWIFGIACWVTIATRVLAAIRTFTDAYDDCGPPIP